MWLVVVLLALRGGEEPLIEAARTGDTAALRSLLDGDGRPLDDLSEHRWLLFALDVRDGSAVWERELHRGVPETKRAIRNRARRTRPRSRTANTS